MNNYHHAVERTIYVGNIGRSVTEQALLALFGNCGTITNIRLAGDPTFDTRYAFIEFSHPDELKTALLLDGMHVFEHAIRVSPARGGGSLRSNDPDRVNKTIHVAGLPMEDIEEDVLAEFFSHCGEVVAVRKNGRFAWVEFGTVSGMQAALNLDGEPMGNSTMKVQQSRTPIMNAGWRASGNDVDPAQQHAGSEYDMQNRFPQDCQYDNQFFWNNPSVAHAPQAPINARGVPSIPIQSVVPAAPVAHSYNFPPMSVNQQPGIMLPGTGIGNASGFTSTINAPSFQGNAMQPPPPGTMKMESEMAN